MSLTNSMKGKSIGFYLTALTFVLTLAAFIVYFPYGNFYSYNTFSVTLLVAVLLACITVALVKPNAGLLYVSFLIPVCATASAALTLYDRVELIKGWATGMSMFGDASRINLLFIFLGLSLAAAVASAIACFFQTDRD